MRIIDGSGHQNVGLAARVSEHDPLIARALVLVPESIHPLRDIRRLGMNVRDDFRVFPVETMLFVADLANGLSGDLPKPVVVQRVRTPHLAGQGDEIGGTHGFARDPGLRILRQERIHDRIGYAVANLVRMTLGNGLTRKDVIAFPHS